MLRQLNRARLEPLSNCPSSAQVPRPRVRSDACGLLSGARPPDRRCGGPLLQPRHREWRSPTTLPQCSEGEGVGAQLRSILWACTQLTRMPRLGFLAAFFGTLATRSAFTVFCNKQTWGNLADLQWVLIIERRLLNSETADTLIHVVDASIPSAPCHVQRLLPPASTDGTSCWFAFPSLPAGGDPASWFGWGPFQEECFMSLQRHAFEKQLAAHVVPRP